MKQVVKINNLLSLVFDSSLSEVCENNSSFDSAVLRICYSGENRNGSKISKDTLEKCIPSIYNCPIVCNYNREEDSLGGHDIEIVKDDDGSYKLVNLTQPVGVVPESANVWFEEYEEEDGTTHEYLYADVLLWKRQEAYKKIIKDGIVKHSMEINVKDGESKDGVYNIYDFEFTAFALIGCEPCFEGSALETFSNDNFKKEYFKMLKELKDEVALISPSKEDDDIHPQKYSSEEGGKVLDNTEILEEKTLKEDEVIIDVNEETNVDDDKNEDPVEVKVEEPVNNFALSSNIIDCICEALSAVTIKKEYGEYPKYYYVDHSPDKLEVYARDWETWKLYGFSYVINGDKVDIDFETKKRCKYEIVDFDEGDVDDDKSVKMLSDIISSIEELYEVKEKYENGEVEIESLKSELNELKKFKSDVEEQDMKNKKEELFNKFSELTGNEAFESLIGNCDDMSIEQIEEKCYAIKGRLSAFSISHNEDKAPKIIVNRDGASEEPYGGLFSKYGYEK